MKVLSVLTIALLLPFVLSGLAEAGWFGPFGGPAAVFPYIIKDDPNTTTIISVIVPDAGGQVNNDDAAELHYVYLHKSIDAAQTDACEEYNFKGHTSPNDLVTFDVSGMTDLGGGLPLFDDTTSDPLQAGNTLALTVNRQIGYLVVEVLASDNTSTGDSDEDGQGGELFWPDGEAIILDLANGGAWGYKASNEYWYHDEQAWLCGYEDCDETAVPTTVYPDLVAKTEFVITPFSDLVLDGPNGEGNPYDSALLTNQSVIVQAVANDTPTPQIYDRNENTLSATKEKKVTCTGIATLDELLGSGILNNPAFLAQGGWGWLWNKPFDVDGDEQLEAEEQNHAFVFKVESSSELGRFMINAIPNGGDGLCIDANFVDRQGLCVR